jgi:hypothetical protein
VAQGVSGPGGDATVGSAATTPERVEPSREPSEGDPLQQQIINNGPLSETLFEAVSRAAAPRSDLAIRGRADVYSPLHPGDRLADIVFDTPDGVVEVIFQHFAFERATDDFIEFDLGTVGVSQAWPEIGRGYVKDAGEARSVTLYSIDGYMLSVQASRRSEDLGALAPLTVDELEAWALAIVDEISTSHG